MKFNYTDYKFYDKYNGYVNSLEIEESLINDKEDENYSDKIKIEELINNVWVDSTKIFLNKKRNKEYSFHKIFINKLIKKNIKSNKLILEEGLKSKIIEELKLGEESKLFFIGNCFPKNFEFFDKKFLMFLIFRYKHSNYLYYNDNYYEIINSFGKWKLKKVKGKKREELVNFSKGENTNKISLEEISKKSRKISSFKKKIKKNLIENRKLTEKKEYNITILKKNLMRDIFEKKDNEMTKVNEVSKNLKNINEIYFEDLNILFNSLECYIYIIINSLFCKKIINNIIFKDN